MTNSPDLLTRLAVEGMGIAGAAQARREATSRSPP